MGDRIDLVTLIIVLVIVTSIIFLLAITAFLSINKAEKAMVDLGQRDAELLETHKKENEDKGKHKRKKITIVALQVVSYAFSAIFLAGVIFATVTHAHNDMIFAGNKTSLVVASNSMSSIADKENDIYHQMEEHGGHLTKEARSEEFKRGDILTLDKLPSQEEIISRNGEGDFYYVDNGINFKESVASPYLNKVFAFKYNGVIIVHRLVKITPYTDIEGKEAFVYIFQGDLYPTQEQRVTYHSLQAVYDGKSKVPTLGYSILFLSSTFGLYSIISCIGMIAISTVFSYRIDKMHKNRLNSILLGERNNPIEEEKQ